MRLTDPFAGSFPEMLNLALALLLAANAAGAGDFAALCDAGNGEACNQVAMTHHDGRGVPQDLRKAELYYTKACQAGYGAGCQNLGDLQAQFGTEASASQARAAWARAATLLRKACDEGSITWCVNLGTLVEDGRLAPEGAPRSADAEKADLLTAAGLYKRACDRGDAGGCINLADFHLHGRGVAKDERKARSLLKRSCDGLKTAAGERDRGHAAGACMNLALILETTDPRQALALERKACDGGLGGACGNLGVTLSRAKNPDWKAANSLLRRGCDSGDPISCWNLALSVDAGLGIARDPAEASSLRQRACNMGLQKACR